jgi:hypothetical protein
MKATSTNGYSIIYAEVCIGCCMVIGLHQNRWIALLLRIVPEKMTPKSDRQSLRLSGIIYCYSPLIINNTSQIHWVITPCYDRRFMILLSKHLNATKVRLKK